MKRWLTIILIAGLMVVSATGCSKKETPETAQPPAQNSQSQSQTQPGTDLGTLMKSAAAVKQMSFDSVMTMTSNNTTTTSAGKIYISDTKMRMETEMNGMKSITISKSPSEIYIYNPDTKTAMKLTSSTDDSAEIPTEWAQASGDTSRYKIIGEEKKDGFDCVVVQYTDPANAAVTSKMWVRKDNGLPVRVEAKTSDGTIVSEYKNYNLGTQDASLFELPAGTQIVSFPTNPNLPNLPH
jgi:outer membrane lipoprotein-sorting protein